MDPYNGSGTTGVAAIYEGCGEYTGIDLDRNPETGEPEGYMEITEARVGYAREVVRSAGAPAIRREGAAKPKRVRVMSKGEEWAQADLFDYITEPVTYPTPGEGVEQP